MRPGGRRGFGRRGEPGDGSGTIWCDVPPFARFAYWGDPEATRRAWRGAACTVGDLGRLDEDGYLYLSGRRHDLIISGGVNVYPAEVEAVLSAVPGVLQLAVFGVPDEEWGQKVCVAYVADRAGVGGGHAGGRLDPSRTVQAAQGLLRHGELPHTATGKLLRRAVPAHLGLPEGTVEGEVEGEAGPAGRGGLLR